MKKNISINLYGTLYAIDEDAYDLLEQYLNSMKSYFSRNEGGEEIADDIEHRVAELLWQQKVAGAEAINIDMIKQIINTIGDPEQIDNGKTAEKEETAADNSNSTENKENTNAEDASGNSNANKGVYDNAFNSNYGKEEGFFDRIRSNMKGRRLYRDLNDKIIGGVCSGLAHYFGGDPTIWRLGAALAFFGFFVYDGIGGLVTITYIALWIILPVVRTTEDKLRMRGEEVNAQNINQEILNESNRQNDPYVAPKEAKSGCLKFAGAGCLVMLAFPLAAVLVISLFTSIFLGGLTSGLFNGTSSEGTLLACLFSLSHGTVWAIIISIFMVLLIPVFGLVRWLRGSRQSHSSSTTWILLLLWLLSLFTCIYLVSNKLGDSIRKLDTVNWQYNNNVGPDDSVWEEDTLAIDTSLLAPIEDSTSVTVGAPDDTVKVVKKVIRSNKRLSDQIKVNNTHKSVKVVI